MMEVDASVRAPEQPTEVLYEPERATEVREVTLIYRLAGSYGRQGQDLVTQNDNQEVVRPGAPIQDVPTVFETVDDRVTAIKEQYQTKNDQTVQEVPSLSNSSHVLTVVKWRKTTLEIRKKALDELRQALRNFCEIELNNLHPMLTAPTQVEFGTVTVQVCHSSKTCANLL